MSGKTIKCPTCKATITPGFSGKPNYPFCSERCQAVDLGRWLAEEYFIPGTSNPELEEVDQESGNSEDSSGDKFL